ncbi:DUF2236 domain-containing protein [Massilia sp. ML15P13]|uniref:DUF2236 domain-containing protein n=2 Tax=Telluria aromaticivorans TaxID=2725995 RepID=A0A7Y2NZC0_9BURK|nr:oxygenase MpaB family protein [Telluria aromaticivorans]NNG21659.1 DUF2236 domain-containing protein [Telluria aromaticivorans]
MRADPLADDTIARILAGADLPEMARRIGAVNRELAGWDSNGVLVDWCASSACDPEIAAALEAYVRDARTLPAWAEAAAIARAEASFMDTSMLSCTLLFCASLPECYVLPDLSAVLHVAGGLEQHTDYRIRSTAAMIFPVLLRGGLEAPAGGGVAQAIKVRLIHATIRHLILRGAPPAATQAIRPLPPQAPAGPGMYAALYARGWDTGRDGLPCNQEQLAYTLLTFGYVFLRGLRSLGLTLPQADEQACLHAWNVLGHVLGIEQASMASTMSEAAVLFDGLQARGRRVDMAHDPRPQLAAALMQEMAREIPLRPLKSFPVLLTRHLCGPAVSSDLGLTQRVALPVRALFAFGLGATRLFDALVRLAVPGFSITRMVTRAFGYRLVTRFLMDQTRPLKLPDALLGQVAAVTAGWKHDPQAPRWVNRFEARLAGRPAPQKGQA